MKKQSLLLLLSSLIVASCTTTANSPVESSKEEQEPSTEEKSLSTSSSVEETTSEFVESSSSVEESSSVDESPSVEESPSVDESPSAEESSSIDEPTDEQSSSEYVDPLINQTKKVKDFLGSDGDVYRINITTENGAFPAGKEEYVKGTLNMTEQDTSIVELEDSVMGIKLRGNSTLDARKKAFKIKFDKKQSFFGLPKNKQWVLLANYFDKSNLRNYLAYTMARKMTNLKYQPSSIFVDVYFNNEYYGLFTLCEQMEANPGRVDVKDKVGENGIDSLFIEADVRARDEYKGYADIAYVDLWNYCFTFKYPDPDDYFDALVDKESEDEKTAKKANEFIDQYLKDISWFKNYMNTAIDTLHNKGKYQEYFDVDSFIDYYLVEEFFKNVDVGSTSQYYYIDQTEEKPLIHTGPVWDFDISSGVTGNDYYSTYNNNDLYVKIADQITKYFFRIEDFQLRVKDRYTELRNSVFAAVFDDINEAKIALKKAQERNLTKWPIGNLPRTAWIEIYAYTEYYNSIATLDDHYVFLQDNLQDRLQIMDDNYLWK